jgi:ABC-type transport system substrate-binding protein
MTLARRSDYRQRRWEDLLTPASRSANPSHPMAGRSLPGSDRIELSNTPEASAELLSLRRKELDVILLNSPEIATTNGALKREIAADGVRLVRDPAPVVYLTFFSMRDPVLGGNAPEKVALRRAIQMSIDNREWIRVIDAGFSSERQQIVPPGIDGHIEGHRDPNRFDPATANALLDRFGYRRGAGGYRSKPDGSALAVPILSGTSSESRKSMEFMKRMLDRIGVRAAFENVPTAERLKRMTQCRFGMANMDWGLDVPDGTNPMSMFYSKAIGGANMSCFVDAEFDAAFERALVTPPGPGRTALFRTMQARLDAYAPMGTRPAFDILVLTRDNIVGPFSTIIDWLQLTTLTVDPASSPPARKR